MTGSPLLDAGVQGMQMDGAGALLRGAVSALALAALLLAPQGLASSLAVAMSVSLLMGWASLAWMQGQGRQAQVRSGHP